jgi:hypothetical protein
MFRTNNGGFRIDGGSVNIQDTPLAIGDYFGGGVVVYFLQSGDPGYVAGQQHGLIAAVEDQAPAFSTGWGCSGTNITSLTGGIGGGLASTNRILQACTARPIAASVARSYSGGGFFDWFLPNLSEAQAIWTNRSFIPGLAGTYWTSTQVTSQETIRAYSKSSSDTIDSNTPKTNSNGVRACRYF